MSIKQIALMDMRLEGNVSDDFLFKWWWEGEGE